MPVQKAYGIGFSPVLQGFQDETVRPVHHGSVQGGKINAGGHFRIVSQRLADCGNGDVLAFGDACPSVTCDVGRQRDGQSQTFAYSLQLAVYPVRLAPVLPPFVRAVVLDDGKQVRRTGGVVLVYLFLHRFFPLDEQLLAGLAPPVGKDTVLQVLFPEECHVHE